MKKIIVIVIFTFVLGNYLNAAPHAYEDNDSVEIEESPIIKFVRNGVMPGYSNSVTLGNALEYWAKQQNCDYTYWEDYKTEREEQIVNFRCIFNEYKFKALEDTDVYKSYKKSIERYPSDINELKKWEEYYTTISKEFLQFEYLFQFLVSLDGKTFNEGFKGLIYHFEDGKTYEQANPYLLQIAYRGNKEKTHPLSILEGSLGQAIYQNRR